MQLYCSLVLEQAADAVAEEAVRSGQYFINHRWLGGTLTNWGTIQKRIARLKEIKRMEEDGTFEVLPKKEVALLNKHVHVLKNSWVVSKICLVSQMLCT